MSKPSDQLLLGELTLPSAAFTERIDEGEQLIQKTDIEKTEANEYDSNTNVLKFRDAYTGPKHYTNGVGTRFGFFGRFAGGAFGIGGQDRINDALDELRKRLAAGDRHIDIIGFSRGAALALAFANRLTKRKATACGLPIDPARVNAAAAGCDSATRPKWPRDLFKNRKRDVLENNRIHHTVTTTYDKECNDPPGSCAVESKVDEVMAQQATTFQAG